MNLIFYRVSQFFLKMDVGCYSGVVREIDGSQTIVVKSGGNDDCKIESQGKRRQK